jgi:predicted lipid-binding transport protein (Tim44 family)
MQQFVAILNIVLNAILVVLLTIECRFFATTPSSQPQANSLAASRRRQLTVKTPQTPNGINPA